VSRDAHENEGARFGYDELAVAAARAERLRRWAEGRLREQGLDGIVRLEIDGDGWKARHELPPNMDPAVGARLDIEARRFYRDLKLRFPGEWEAVTDALLRERGLLLDDGRMRIDHADLAARAAPPLEDCSVALRWAAGRGADRRLLRPVRGGRAGEDPARPHPRPGDLRVRPARAGGILTGPAGYWSRSPA
jgi:hypothetical protein